MTVTLKIEKNVYGGDGLGRLGDGRVCFVPGAFEGETVRAEITEQKKRYVKARLAEIVEASSDRREPGVVVPGMVYAGVSYEAEVRMKRDQLANFLQKAAPGAPAPTVVAAPQPLRYRNKVVYHTEKRNGAWVLGYRTEPEHQVVDTPQDPLACPEINAELPNIRAGVFALLTQGAKAVRQSARAADNVTVRWTPIDGVTWWLGEPPRGLELHETTDGRRFRVAAGGFYQVNPQVGDALVKAVREAYAAGAAEAPHILDLYCGVGVFGLACLAGGTAAETPRLVGVESDREAVASAKRNAESLRVPANFFCERVGASLGRIKVGRQHTVIADPPRGGMEPNVPGWLANRLARRVLYVSCDPATLARDLAALAKAYTVRDVRLFDMFPRTARFETLVTLERKEQRA